MVLMINLDRLTLLSGVDIYIPSLELEFHPPKLREIGIIGEDKFFHGCGMMNIDKYQIEVSDRTILEDKSNFDIFMSIMTDENDFSAERRTETLLFLNLIFPTYEISFSKQGFFLKKEGFSRKINEQDFENIRKIINIAFRLEDPQDKVPEGELARKIFEKLQEGKRKIAKMRGQDNKNSSIFSLYASILAVGQNIDINSILNYTIYQLFDQQERFQLKIENDMYYQAMVAGAKGMNQPDNWMKNLYNNLDSAVASGQTVF